MVVVNFTKNFRFKKINFKGEQEMKYNKDWEKFEKIIDKNNQKK